VRLTRFKRHSQSHALAQHMLLADNFSQSARAQLLGKG